MCAFLYFVKQFQYLEHQVLKKSSYIGIHFGKNNRIIRLQHDFTSRKIIDNELTI